jgi:hypothetical protein
MPSRAFLSVIGERYSNDHDFVPAGHRRSVSPLTSQSRRTVQSVLGCGVASIILCVSGFDVRRGNYAVLRAFWSRRIGGGLERQ